MVDLVSFQDIALTVCFLVVWVWLFRCDFHAFSVSVLSYFCHCPCCFLCFLVFLFLRFFFRFLTFGDVLLVCFCCFIVFQPSQRLKAAVFVVFVVIFLGFFHCCFKLSIARFLACFLWFSLYICHSFLPANGCVAVRLEFVRIC